MNTAVNRRTPTKVQQVLRLIDFHLLMKDCFVWLCLRLISVILRKNIQYKFVRMR
jgi:hypothetical protein